MFKIEEICSAAAQWRHRVCALLHRLAGSGEKESVIRNAFLAAAFALLATVTLPAEGWAQTNAAAPSAAQQMSTEVNQWNSA